MAILYNCTDAVSSAEKKFGKDDARNVTTANAAVYLGGGLAILALLKYLSNRGNTLVVKEGSPDLLHDLGRGVALVALTHAAPFAWSRSRAAASDRPAMREFSAQRRARASCGSRSAHIDCAPREPLFREFQFQCATRRSLPRAGHPETNRVRIRTPIATPP